MSNSGSYYGVKRELKRADFFKSFSTNDNVTEYMLRIIDEKIETSNPLRILDLGTGNGYLIREVEKRNKSKLNSTELIGIDSSSEMVEIAQNNKPRTKVNFFVMDNNHLQFEDNSFDLVIAKAVSNVSISEVYRILNNDGWFVYKEYGPGKGIVEVMKNMKKLAIHSGDKLVNSMETVGFKRIELMKFYIPLLRSFDELNAIIDTMRILPNKITRPEAHKIVDVYFGGRDVSIIHSDPYLVVGQK